MKIENKTSKQRQKVNYRRRLVKVNNFITQSFTQNKHFFSYPIPISDEEPLHYHRQRFHNILLH